MRMRDVRSCETFKSIANNDPVLGFISACQHVYRTPQILSYIRAHYNATPDIAQIITMDSKARQESQGTDDRQRSLRINKVAKRP